MTTILDAPLQPTPRRPRRGRGRPRRIPFDWSAASLPPSRPVRAASYEESVYRLGELREHYARRNEGKRPARLAGRPELREAVADVLAWAYLTPDRDAGTVAYLPPDLIDLGAAASRVLELQAEKGLAPWSPEREAFIFACYAVTPHKTHRLGRIVESDKARDDVETFRSPLSKRERRYAAFFEALPDMRREYARAKTNRTPRYLKAEAHVLAGGDVTETANASGVSTTEETAALAAFRKNWKARTGTNAQPGRSKAALRLNITAALAAKPTDETLDERIERQYIAWIAADRVKTILRREETEAAKAGTVPPVGMVRYGLDTPLQGIGPNASTPSEINMVTALLPQRDQELKTDRRMQALDIVCARHGLEPVTDAEMIALIAASEEMSEEARLVAEELADNEIDEHFLQTQGDSALLWGCGMLDADHYEQDEE